MDLESDVEDHTVRMVSVPDAVAVFRPPATDYQVMTPDMIEELRRRLRAAEEREAGSGIRERPTPVDGLEREPIPDEGDDLEDLEIEVEATRTIGEWADTFTAPVSIEVALAPNSESNFYGGFDEEFPDGVFLATYQAIPASTPVYAVVHLPGGYRFRTPALVEFVREPEAATLDAPAGVGLRMCGLDGRMRRLIREFAKHRPPMFYIG